MTTLLSCGTSTTACMAGRPLTATIRGLSDGFCWRAQANSTPWKTPNWTLSSFSSAANARRPRDSRAFTYMKLGEIDSAIKEYDAVLQRDPEKPYSLYGRGMAKQKKGDVVGGEADILAAKAIKPDIAEKFAEIGVRPGDP